MKCEQVDDNDVERENLQAMLVGDSCGGDLEKKESNVRVDGLTGRKGGRCDVVR